jgi:outer membrane receptor protein involved in Fe transport
VLRRRLRRPRDQPADRQPQRARDPIAVGGAINPNGNNIINVLTALGQTPAAFTDAFSRRIYVTPGRSYAGETEDKGISLEANWDLGGATLTSITAYRDYKSDQGSDTDYSTVDILFRAPNGGAARGFETFSQELRLQGELFAGKLDWLVGAYYADEDLLATDNLRFGNQYGRFATCRVVSGIASLAPLFSPGSPGCLAARPPAFGPASPLIFGGFDRLDSVNNRGSTLDVYNQNSRNYAFFTHNIFHITDQIDLTLGARYTNERKRFDATFGNDNTACVAQQASLGPLLGNAALAPLAGALIGLACQGNSTAELNGVSINDRRSEDEFTGTGVLSYKPNDDVLVYASYSRGYKAGGFNLDRSALKSPIVSFASVGGAQALVKNLQFDQEINDAYELGFKYSSRPFNLNIAVFRQEFENFQLNTFNGTVFLVQNINGCDLDLGTTDSDLSPATGACAADKVKPGVRSQGIEVESSFRPMRYLGINAGFTYADTKYRDNLVGSDQGAPLDPALRRLPGRNLSNAPEITVTGSATWTPPLGASGLSGLLYVDFRHTGDFNTGSDLFPQKAQDGFTLVNARIGVRGPDERWAIEGWAQNLFNVNYQQVAFNSPFQAGATSAPFVDPQFPGGRQIFSSFWPSRAPTASLSARSSDRFNPPRAALGEDLGGSLLRRRLPRRFQQSRLQRLQPRRVLDPRALQVRQVEDVDRAFAIGGDVGGMDGGLRLEDGAGETAEQGGAVARIHLHHRIAVGGGGIDEHGGADVERLRPGERQRLGLEPRHLRLLPRDRIRHRRAQPLDLVRFAERPAGAVLQQEIVERHAVAGRVDARVDHVRAGQADRAGEAVEQARLVLGVDGEQGRPALGLHAHRERTHFGGSPVGGIDEAGVRLQHLDRLGEPVAVRQVPGEAREAAFLPVEPAGQLLLDRGHPLAPAALLVAEPQMLLGGIEQLAQQLALPAVPHRRADRADVDHGQDQEQPQPLQALHPPAKVGDRLGVGKVALERGRRHQQVPAHQPGDRLRLRLIEAEARASSRATSAPSRL